MAISIEQEIGVCPLIVHPKDSDFFLAIMEMRNKEYSYKLAGMFGPGFETVEWGKGEDHRGAIDRFFIEEVAKVRGQVFIPDNLEEAKFCRIQLSQGVWVAVYHVTVSEDFEAVIGTAKEEVSTPVWLSRSRILKAINEGGGRLLFRTGTREILESFRDKFDYGLQYHVREYPDPMRPFPPEVFEGMTKGLTPFEALYRSGVDPIPLINSLISIHLLSRQEFP